MSRSRSGSGAEEEEEEAETFRTVRGKSPPVGGEGRGWDGEEEEEVGEAREKTRLILSDTCIERSLERKGGLGWVGRENRLSRRRHRWWWPRGTRRGGENETKRELRFSRCRERDGGGRGLDSGGADSRRHPAKERRGEGGEAKEGERGGSHKII